MDKSAIDTPSREIDLRNISVHLRTALRRALEFEARAPAPRSAEEAEQCEEQLRAIADEFFGALLTPVLQRAVRSAAVGDAASALVRHLPRRMRSDGLETVNVRMGIPVKWNSVSGDLEHGFRRSGTLVGA